MFKQIIKFAKKLLIAQNIRLFKQYLKEKLNQDQTLSELDKSTMVGNLTKKIIDLFTANGITNNAYKEKVFDLLIEINPSISDDFIEKANNVIQMIKDYDYIVKNMTNKLNIQQRNINNFKNYEQLHKFLNELQQQKKQLQELQRIRSIKLPFNKLYTNGNYSMYQINKEDKQNFQNMFSGEDGIITKTSWCVGFKDKTYFYSQGLPYYLITNKNNVAEALISIQTRQFKKVNDKRYDRDNKEVCELVIQLLSDNNIHYKDYKGQFQILIKFLPNQQKQEIITDYIEKEQYDQLLHKIQVGYLPELTYQKHQYIIESLIKNKRFQTLFNCFKKGELKNKLPNQQKQEIIYGLINRNNYRDLFYYIKQGYLSELTYQQQQYIINILIKGKSFITLFNCLEEGVLKSQLTNQQKQQIFDGINTDIQLLLKYIKQGYLPALTDQKQQQIINNFIKEKNFITLFNCLKDDRLKSQLTNQQKQQIFDGIKNDIDYSKLQLLFQYIEQGYLPALTDQKQQQIMNSFIKNGKFQGLFDCLKEGVLKSQLTNQQKQQFFDYIKNNTSYSTLQWLYTYINEGYLLPLTNQQQQWIINDLITEYAFGQLFQYIKEGVLSNNLTSDQQNLIYQQMIDHYKERQLISYLKKGYFTNIHYDTNMIINSLIQHGHIYSLLNNFRFDVVKNYLKDYNNKEFVTECCVNEIQKDIHKYGSLLIKSLKNLYLNGCILKLNYAQSDSVIDAILKLYRYDLLLDNINNGVLEIPQQKQDIIFNKLLKSKKIDVLFQLIKKGCFKNLTKQQKDKINDYYLKNNNFSELFNKIETGKIPELSPQMKQKIIDQSMYFPSGYTILLRYNKYLSLSNEQKNIIIDKAIEDENISQLIFLSNQDWLNNITDQQKKKIIILLVKNKDFYDLFNKINKGYLPALTDQQKQKIIMWLLDNNKIDNLVDFISMGYLPQITNRSYNDKITNYFIKQNKIVRLLNLIKKGMLPKLTKEQYFRIKQNYPGPISAQLVKISKILSSI